MPLPAAPTRKTTRGLKQANSDLLIKGLLCVAIGLAILLAPYGVKSPELLQVLGQSQWLGWFALILGVALSAVHAKRRMAPA
jgi:hypothetical protein